MLTFFCEAFFIFILLLILIGFLRYMFKKGNCLICTSFYNRAWLMLLDLPLKAGQDVANLFGNRYRTT